MSRGRGGNFRSDTAADFVAGLVEELVAQVVSAVARPTSIEPDEYYGEVVPAIIEIVATLHELTGTASLPKPEVVAKWKLEYMKVWEARIDGLSPSPQYKKARREVLNRTFDRLEQLSSDLFEKS